MKFLHFIPDNNAEFEDVPNPSLVRDVLPEWYKKSEITVTTETGEEHNGLKTCVPFLDAMISGFVLKTWTDIHVRKLEDGTLDIDWGANTSSDPIMERNSKIGHLMPRPAGHLPNHLVWTPKWGVKAPRGYSCLFTHPLNRFDLPFTTMSGIIDSDKLSTSGNIPFFIKEGFEGVIPAGTPIIQIIPIKRKKWTAVYDPALFYYMHELGHKLRGVARGYYRDNFWVKKVYNMYKRK